MQHTTHVPAPSLTADVRMVMGTITDAARRRIPPPPLSSSAAAAAGDSEVSAEQQLPTRTRTATRAGSDGRRPHIILDRSTSITGRSCVRSSVGQ
jgi:hypothetical protein